MEIKVQTKIGDDVFFLESKEKDLKEGLAELSVIMNAPSYCTCCKENNSSMFKLEVNKDLESNIYVKIKCKKCGAAAKLGTNKGNKGYFWHPFEKYIKKETV